MDGYKRMFEDAVRTLAAIDEALGIGDDGCGDPGQTLDMIEKLKAAAVIRHVYGAEAEQITRPLKEKISILRDSAKDVLAWADGLEKEPYSFARLRAAIAATETPNDRDNRLDAAFADSPAE